MYKRILRKGRYYVISRDKKGRIKTLRSWTPKRSIDQKTSYYKGKKTRRFFVRGERYKGIDRRKDKLLSSKTRIYEMKRDRPQYRKKGQLQLTVKFKAANGEVAEVTGRSYKGYISTNYRPMYDHAYKLALSQLDFSPISHEIKEVHFVYWLKE